MNEQLFSMQNIQDTLSRRKSANEREHKARIEKIYKEIPRIAELDALLSSTNMGLARRLALQGTSEGFEISLQKKKNQEIKEEKHQLLLSHGYPIDFLDTIYTCPICKDEGYDADRKVCECVTRLKIEEFYRCSNLGKVLELENFDTFDLSLYSKEILPAYQCSPFINMSEKLEKAKQFVRDFDEKGGNILIYGETGLGKTFLSNCIAKALLDTCHGVLYLSANELFDKILAKATFAAEPDSFTERIREYVYRADLLIIDDLGTELTNNFVVSQLFEIVNQRHLSGRSTLISTNLTLAQIQSLYSERIMSRFVESYDLYQIIGKNIRYQKHLV